MDPPEQLQQETHATQLQRILTELGVKSREELLKGEPGEPAAAPAPPEDVPEVQQVHRNRDLLKLRLNHNFR